MLAWKGTMVAITKRAWSWKQIHQRLGLISDNTSILLRWSAYEKRKSWTIWFVSFMPWLLMMIASCYWLWHTFGRSGLISLILILFVSIFFLWKAKGWETAADPVIYRIKQNSNIYGYLRQWCFEIVETGWCSISVRKKWHFLGITVFMENGPGFWLVTWT